MKVQRSSCFIVWVSQWILCMSLFLFRICVDVCVSVSVCVCTSCWARFKQSVSIAFCQTHKQNDLYVLVPSLSLYSRFRFFLLVVVGCIYRNHKRFIVHVECFYLIRVYDLFIANRLLPIPTDLLNLKLVDFSFLLSNQKEYIFPNRCIAMIRSMSPYLLHAFVYTLYTFFRCCYWYCWCSIIFAAACFFFSFYSLSCCRVPCTLNSSKSKFRSSQSCSV